MPNVNDTSLYEAGTPKDKKEIPTLHLRILTRKSDTFNQVALP